MIDETSSTRTESAEFELPAGPIDLSGRMREIRARQGLKQSEVARKMGLDPSIPSLWEQGKRPVPATRVVALADALGVTVQELLSGAASENPHSLRPSLDSSHRPTLSDFASERAARYQPLTTLTSIVPSTPVASIASSLPVDTGIFAEPPRRLLPRIVASLDQPPTGVVPDGWEPADRVQDISPSLPDGYWLDPNRAERSGARALLRKRLCAEDQAAISAEPEVTGAAIMQRIYDHCAHQSDFFGLHLPIVEAIFRAVLASEYAGLTPDGLAEVLDGHTGAVKITPTLLRRLADSVRSYPMLWVDRELFR